MPSGRLAVDIVVAVATSAAVIVALWTSQRTLRLERRRLKAEGRRQAATDIARWLQRAETGILAWHNPENWRVPEGMKFGRRTRIKPGDMVPPSQGRMGPSVEATVQEFDAVRGLARLTFGPGHEVTALVGEVINAVQNVADRGVIYAEEQGPTPREYVDRTFLPLSTDLFEALAEACGLRDDEERVPRSGVSSTDNTPVGWGERRR